MIWDGLMKLWPRLGLRIICTEAIFYRYRNMCFETRRCSPNHRDPPFARCFPKEVDAISANDCKDNPTIFEASQDIDDQQYKSEYLFDEKTGLLHTLCHRHGPEPPQRVRNPTYPKHYFFCQDPDNIVDIFRHLRSGYECTDTLRRTHHWISIGNSKLTEWSGIGTKSNHGPHRHHPRAAINKIPTPIQSRCASLY